MFREKDTIPDLNAAAFEFIELFYTENASLLNGSLLPFEQRWKNIQNSIYQTGTYFHTTEELVFGARVAWRNSNRCVGRLYWKSLEVRDMRHLNDAASFKLALLQHIEHGTKDGKIQPLITVFRQKMPQEQYGMRILNPQLIQYAGYENQDKTVIGDPKNIQLTNFALEKGWQNPRTPFDILPIFFSLSDSDIDEPFMLSLPKSSILEIEIEHPRYEWFKDLGLRWYVLPAVSDMLLEIGGIEYTAAPFNGWYMVTEIGARNLADPDRYNQLPIIGQKLGFDTSKRNSFWKDRAILELNEAVMYSFQQQDVKLANHHAVCEHFTRFIQQEKRMGRDVNADWAWIVPPISGTTTSVFHQEFDNTVASPNFFYQASLLNQFLPKDTKEQRQTCPMKAMYS